MDLFPTPEQELLVETARDFTARSMSSERVRALEAGEHGFDPAQWRAMVDLGWAELAPLELALVSEALGRAAVPSPLPITGALRNALPLGAGELPADAVITLASLVPGARDERSGPYPVAGSTLTATYLLVPYAGAATVVVAATADGPVVVDPSRGGVETRRESVVGGDALFRVDCANAPAEPIADARTDAVGTALDHVAVIALAYAVGAAHGALDLSVQHARDRHQFGRPIGSFQAVAHRCADMVSEIDACRLLAQRAAWALTADAADAADAQDTELAVRSALGYAKDALRRVAMHAHQVHGAIGFSAEYDLHLFTRRIKAFELTAGGAAYHQERFAVAIDLRA